MTTDIREATVVHVLFDKEFVKASRECHKYILREEQSKYVELFGLENLTTYLNALRKMVAGLKVVGYEIEVKESSEIAPRLEGQDEEPMWREFHCSIKPSAYKKMLTDLKLDKEGNSVSTTAGDNDDSEAE